MRLRWQPLGAGTGRGGFACWAHARGFGQRKSDASASACSQAAFASSHSSTHPPTHPPRLAAPPAPPPASPAAASQLRDAYAAEREALLQARREGVAYLVGRSALRAAPGSSWFKVSSLSRSCWGGVLRPVVSCGGASRAPGPSCLSQPALHHPRPRPRSASSWRCCTARWPPTRAPPPPRTTWTARACCRRATAVCLLLVFVSFECCLLLQRDFAAVFQAGARRD